MTSFPPPLPLGCERVCHYGTTGKCRAPEVRRSGPPIPFDVARASGGPCGPEANHTGFTERAIQRWKRNLK